MAALICCCEKFCWQNSLSIARGSEGVANFIYLEKKFIIWEIFWDFKILDMYQYLLSILLVSMFILCLGCLLGCILLYLIAFKYNGPLITFNLC